MLADITPRVFWSKGFFHRRLIDANISATHCFDNVSTTGAVGGKCQVFMRLQASIGGVEKRLLGVVHGKVYGTVHEAVRGCNVVGICGGRKINV